MMSNRLLMVSAFAPLGVLTGIAIAFMLDVGYIHSRLFTLV